MESVRDTESTHLIRQLTHVHIKRKINTGSFHIADSFPSRNFLFRLAFQLRLKSKRYKKKLEIIKVMVVESVKMTSLGRHHEGTEKVISERRDLVVYLPCVVFGR